MKKSPRKKNHGGIRKGAGRPPTGRLRFVTQLSKLNVDYLQHFAGIKRMSTAAYLDLLIARAWENDYQDQSSEYFEDSTEVVKEVGVMMMQKYKI